MSAQQVPALRTTLMPRGNLKARTFVNWQGMQAGAASNTMGLAEVDGHVDSGFVIPVITLGTGIALAGAPLDGTETRLQTDANGMVVPYTSGPLVARLIPGQVAGAAGLPVEVFVIPN